MMNGWCKATWTETGDRILVGYNVVTDRWEYRINDAPAQLVPAEYADLKDPFETAEKLLTRHVAASQATDAEELTLP